MGKRANGEGTILKRKDGRWCASISVEQGRRKSFYGETRKEVHTKLAAALKGRADGLPTVGERQRVGPYLTDWLASVRPTIRPTTYTSYEGNIRNHVTPKIGSVALARLTPQHLQRLYADCLTGGLSSTTVHHIHAVVHKALSQAVKLTLVPRNVADLVESPRARHHEMATLSPEQVRAFLETARGERFEALYVLAATTGMRRGELLALRWRDIDHEGATLQVRATLQRVKSGGFVFSDPKTARSRRQVALTAAAVAALRRHRAAQSAERLRMGAVWEDQDLVFANEIGRPVEAGNLLRRSFFPLLKRAGMPRVRFHDLRHTAATLMMGQAVHPKVVADMLGHSQISTTLDLYSHVTPTMQRQATEAMDAVLNG